MSVRWILCVLAAFAVGAVAAENVTLEWDHSPSPETTGYRIHYGNDSRQYDGHHDVPYQTTWTVTGLTPGTWYFAATAIDAAGNESAYSNEVIKTIAAGELQVTAQAAAVDWYGVVCLATTSVAAKAMFRYRRIQSGEPWLYIIASPEPRLQHRAIIYEAGQQAYYEYEWILDADGTEITAGGTFQTR